MLLEMLHALDQFDLASIPHNSPEYIAILCEIMKQATVGKDRHIGGPAYVGVPLLLPALRPSGRRQPRTRSAAVSVSK